ncbi:MAG: DegV family EDD domain-containing protein [Bacteroidetes bacterium]|nr:DegV family EDD domain-containing protein [Bacteroidota bacterium]MBT7144329.1 DegV family EDD domain-containing protein [Bacteroidota bacterium]
MKEEDLLNGKRLYYSFLAGAKQIFNHQKYLNKINVFPVSDADTGTNMASTMQSIIDTEIPTDSIKQTATALADAALVGARGNSGIIFAQFLYGFGNEIEGENDLSINNFDIAINKAVEYAYDAISNPVEGTMITVIREWAEGISTIKEQCETFQKLIIDSYKFAKKSLSETTEKLEVLRKSKVVDAGALGFVVFLEGMIDFFSHGEIRKILPLRNIVKAEKFNLISHEEITFRYCTEALIMDVDIDKEKLKSIIQDKGDSLVIAGSKSKLRIHIHTDKPADVFEVLYKHGTITHQKVDDMVMQNSVVENQVSKIGFLSDSTSDIPQDLIEKYQIHIVPLSVHFGRNYFLDRTTISSKSFINLLNKSKEYPSTAQPAYKDFYNKYNYLSTIYDSVLSFHISKEMSGTWSNSSKAAHVIANQSDKQFDVINSKRVTGGLGLIVLRAVKEIENGAQQKDIVEKVDDWIQKTKVFITTKTTKYLVKSGRLNPVKGAIGNFLNLKPLLYVNENGKIEALKKSFGEKGCMNQLIDKVKELVEKHEIYDYAISHVNCKASAELYASQLEKVVGKKPIWISEASPVLGVNTGPGTIGVSVMLK